MEAAQRRAALRGGLRLATGSRRLRCGCRRLIHETRPKLRTSSTLDSGSVHNHHEPGLDGDSRFARVDVHAGEEEDAWLLEAHAL